MTKHGENQQGILNNFVSMKKIQILPVLNIIVAIFLAVASSGSASTRFSNSLINGCLGLTSKVFF